MNKNAVILFNLGGPDNLDSVESFLFNLFYDKAIINLPNPFRWLIAKIISKRRVETAQEIYKKLGGASPIYGETLKQKNAIEQKLNSAQNLFKVFICMRYSKPFSDDVIKELEKEDFNQIILLPLYPHFSTTTTESSIKDFASKLKKNNLDIPIKTICCYPKEENFIESHVNLIKKIYNQIENKDRVRILFSAHGLPERIIKAGDPYQWQIEQTCENIVNKLDIDNLDYKICYQSRVGPLKWIGPATDDEIILASKENLNLVIVPIAFVSEHSETLVELDIEYKTLAEEHNAKGYFRVPTLSLEENFIDSLVNLCLKIENLENKNKINYYSSELKRICPNNFCKCINNYD
ncbi:MAG: ferrochelatase [Alphaproteobacteria bacterium]